VRKGREVECDVVMAYLDLPRAARKTRPTVDRHRQTSCRKSFCAETEQGRPRVLNGKERGERRWLAHTRQTGRYNSQRHAVKPHTRQLASHSCTALSCTTLSCTALRRQRTCAVRRNRFQAVTEPLRVTAEVVRTQLARSRLPLHRNDNKVTANTRRSLEIYGQWPLCGCVGVCRRRFALDH
jgi:hypothetical protein